MKFRDLTKKQRHTIKRNLRMAFEAAGYDVVHGPDQMLRTRGSVEFAGEDAALPAYNRLKMINMARQGMRNGDSLRALMKQMELNVVGTVGGKATFAFPEGYEGIAGELREAFATWASEAEFSDSLPFSKVLSLVVDSKFIGGDMVLLFDDGLVEDSGKLLAFEPDEIANVPRSWLHAKFPEDWTQRQGRIYNQNGRFCGVTVSHKYRGAQMFRHDPDGVLFLMKDPSQSVQDWVMLREVWRFNQGRGTPPLAAPLDSLLDLESVTKFEVQAAMKNCQTLGQIYSTVSRGGDGEEEADELDPDLAKRAAAAGGEDDADAVADAAGGGDGMGEEIELENIKGSGAIFDLLPDNYKMELLDTKRPNPNVEGFVKWLSGRSGAAVGLAKCYGSVAELYGVSRRAGHDVADVRGMAEESRARGLRLGCPEMGRLGVEEGNHRRACASARLGAPHFLGVAGHARG